MRSYTGDGVARGGGIVVELPHEGMNGEIASFHLSVREGAGGGGVLGSDEVSADYSIRRGERVERCGIQAGSATSSRRGAGR